MEATLACPAALSEVYLQEQQSEVAMAAMVAQSEPALSNQSAMEVQASADQDHTKQPLQYTRTVQWSASSLTPTSSQWLSWRTSRHPRSPSTFQLHAISPQNAISPDLAANGIDSSIAYCQTFLKYCPVYPLTLFYFRDDSI
jgi:hypothetical protein